MNRKKIERVEEQLWRMGINATPSAVLVEQLTRPVTIAFAPIFNQLEQVHGINVKTCWKGVVLEKDGDIIYEDGKYETVAAMNESQRVTYRRRIYMMLRWCCTHYPTDLLNKHKAWIYGR
jgi:hypothetical protein